MRGMNRFAPPLAALAALIVAAPILVAPALAQPDIRNGRRIARENCARCHAIGPTGRSQRPAATPFRLIPERYPVEALEEAFGEGITGSHKGMPDFQFDPAEIDDLLGYIRSLARRR
jgi:mono/diheme cytochrome c family protein